jgi:hypothetical protein
MARITDIQMKRKMSDTRYDSEMIQLSHTPRFTNKPLGRKLIVTIATSSHMTQSDFNGKIDFVKTIERSSTIHSEALK